MPASREALIARARVMLKQKGTGEGYESFMYLDSKGYVTIGCGKMLPTAASADDLEMQDAAGKPASNAQKEAEWTRVHALWNTKTKKVHISSWFAKDAVLFITDAEGAKWLDIEIKRAIAGLLLHFPDFDSYPEDAQLALIDMVYNLGGKLYSKFHMFMKSMTAKTGPDWTLIAAQSHRAPPVPEARNRLVRDLFLAAARAAAASHAAPALSIGPH